MNITTYCIATTTAADVDGGNGSQGEGVQIQI